MGKCMNCFRANFTPRAQVGKHTSLPLIKPVPDVPGELPRPPSVVVDGGLSPEPGAEDQVIVVKSVDQCVLHNAEVHFTSDYDVVRADVPHLVARRGYPIQLKINFNRPYTRDKDMICLVFTVKGAQNPSYAQGSMILVPILTEDNTDLPADGWTTKLKSAEESVITVEVTPSAKAIIGEWTLEIDTKLKNEKQEEAKTLRYTVSDSIYLLFNPWCLQDIVYMEDTDWRNECVLNDSGLIWRGTRTRLRPCVWNFGQFEPNVLETCCYLLSHISKLSVVARADPVKVVRHISAVVNSPDDAGVLVGNWSNDYGGGQPPTSWSGSVSILQQYLKTKKPVKYGQCWVFSGVVTTVCRALGIPARSVTNFASAHDTHNSLTIDYFYDDNGEPLDKLNSDSVWNFHVWNEVWMERPDLKPGLYGGWQAIDATPQEESDGLYRCGPCSVAAIKRGEIDKPYDACFLFAEVNADKVYWRYRGKNNPLKLIQKKTDQIGCHISTKAVGTYDRLDITENYKYQESSNEEREVMLRALRQCPNAFSRFYLNDNFEDIEFDFCLIDDIVIGSPFTVKLIAKNKNSDGKTYTITAALRVATTLYTGELKKLVKKEKFEKKIAAGAEETMDVQVSYEDYAKALVDQAAFTIAAMARVEETGFDYFAQDDFRVRKPDIKIQVEGDPILGKDLKVTAHLKNPLPRVLKKGVFTIEGPGLGQPLKLHVKENVFPDMKAEVTCTLSPKTCGEKSIVAKFWSRELDDVDGYHVIQVKPALPENPSPEVTTIP